MSKFFDDIKQGLEEAIAFEQGKKTLRTRLIELPDPPKSYTASDIKKIRNSGHYSQGVFAKILNVSVKTVQFWETGERVPSHAALRLLEIVGEASAKLKTSRLPGQPGSTSPEHKQKGT